MSILRALLFVLVWPFVAVVVLAALAFCMALVLAIIAAMFAWFWFTGPFTAAQGKR